MADTTLTTEEPPRPKRSKLPMLVGLVLAVCAGGGGFYATWTGLIFAPNPAPSQEVSAVLPDIAYVPMDPLVITLPPDARSRHLRFTAQLEVLSRDKADVALLLPRVMDLLNGFLRAVDPADLEDPAVLIRLRAQMLRRVQMVTGEGRVRDLLITEFVLN